MNSVLYVSAFASESRIREEYEKTGKNPGFAVQKFSRLLVKGLLANRTNVLALSNPPCICEKKRFVHIEEEKEDGVIYKYVPYLNYPFLKHLCLFFYTFFYVLFWGLRKGKGKAVVCDVLSVSICMGAMIASKINRVLSVAVVTDIYELMSVETKKSFKVTIAGKLNAWYSSSFDKYILLTEQMNEVVNPKGHPHLVMEALCDSSLINDVEDIYVKKSHPRIVMYAGGLYEKYGLKMLAEGFIAANVEDAKLVYYGDGSYVEEYKKLCERYSNLEYGGIVPTETVVAEELRASLLVNPRFTTEEFTKYSFPSKNMEFMASGTPLLTTKLPGMPTEYYQYVYMFEKETVEGYAEAIRKALSHTENELRLFGYNAKQFVLLNKNNVQQGIRVLQFLNK